MNKSFVLSGIFVFAAVLSLGVSPIGSAFAGNDDHGVANPSCGGKATIQGTGDNDLIGINDSTSEVYNLKGGNDFVDDFDPAGERDVFRMGDDNDVVIKAGGNDTVCLGDGDDSAITTDGFADFVKCGDGFDTVFIDPYDVTDGECELINPPGPEI